MRYPAAVIFDLDGTLADSFEAIGRALNAALRELALPTRNHAWVCAHVGLGSGELLRAATPADASAALRRTLHARFLVSYERIFCEQTPPVVGAGDVLRHVAAGTDGRLAVVSNKLERFSRAWLRHWRLNELVAVVVGPDTYGVRKPNAGTVLPVLAGMGVRPEQALLVGDMAVDALAGQNAGVPVVGVRNGFVPAAAMRAAGALAVLHELRDLPPWLAGNGRGWDTISLADAGGET